jgi:plastocyanin
LLSAHPLSFMAYLAVGCPLILWGVLLYLYSLVAKDAATVKSVVLLVFLVTLSAGASACGNSSDGINPAITKEVAAPTVAAFDPSTATARVSGGVLLEGPAPKTPPMAIGGDALCKMSATKIFAGESIVTSDGKLRDVIVYVRSGYEGKSYAIPETPVVLDQQDCVYTPRAITVMKGQKVRILNSDATLHNVHAKDGDRDEFNFPQASKGAEDIKTFSHAAMPFRIGCDFHKWMSAYAGVFEHPFHTATGDTGKYELRLPPGKYEIVAWHHKAGEQVSMVDVSQKGDVQLDFRFSPPAGR